MRILNNHGGKPQLKRSKRLGLPDTFLQEQLPAERLFLISKLLIQPSLGFTTHFKHKSIIPIRGGLLFRSSRGRWQFHASSLKSVPALRPGIAQRAGYSCKNHLWSVRMFVLHGVDYAGSFLPGLKMQKQIQPARKWVLQTYKRGRSVSLHHFYRYVRLTEAANIIALQMTIA